MYFKRVLLFLSFASAVVSLNVYSVDQSVCSSGGNVALHDNGSLRTCELKDNYEANGIRCISRSRAVFCDNGNLESCTLSTIATIGENKCDQFGVISFFPDGNLKSCREPGN
jgi:hypothetical protein